MVAKLHKYRDGYAVFYDNMVSKKHKIEWIIIALLAIISISCFVIVNNSTGMIQIPIFNIIYESLNVAIQFVYGFCKMFATLIWYLVTQNWITVLITFALIASIITGVIYRRAKD